MITPHTFFYFFFYYGSFHAFMKFDKTKMEKKYVASLMPPSLFLWSNNIMRFFNFRFALTGMALAWAAIIGSAQAYSVGDYVYSGGVGIYVKEGSYYDTTSAAVQNSTIVTERRVATVASEAQANMVLSQISDRLETGGSVGGSVSLLPTSGGNAGAADQRSSLWARAGYDHMQEDSISSFGGWNANLWSFALGYDYKFNDRVLAGLALTYSNLNGSTKFNNGSIRDNAYGLVPYVAFRVAPCFDVDLMAGYSRVNKSRTRGTPNAANPTQGDLSGPKAKFSPKSDRWFGAIYANYKHHINRWNLLARLGYMYITDNQKSATERGGLVFNAAGITDQTIGGLTTRLNRLALRLQAGYKANNSVEPYAFLLYARDFGASKIKGVPDSVVANPVGITYTSPNARRSNNTFGGGLGLNGNLGNNWTTGIEAIYTQSKKFKDYGGMLRVAKKF